MEKKEQKPAKRRIVKYAPQQARPGSDENRTLVSLALRLLPAILEQLPIDMLAHTLSFLSGQDQLRFRYALSRFHKDETQRCVVFFLVPWSCVSVLAHSAAS
jgi:hypothetical protein